MLQIVVLVILVLILIVVFLRNRKETVNIARLRNAENTMLVGGVPLLFVDGELSSSQIMNLASSPILLVENQVNTIFVAVSFTMQLSPGSVPFTVVGDGQQYFTVGPDPTFQPPINNGGPSVLWNQNLPHILTSTGPCTANMSMANAGGTDMVAKNLYFGISNQDNASFSISNGNGTMAYRLQYFSVNTIVNPMPMAISQQNQVQVASGTISSQQIMGFPENPILIVPNQPGSVVGFIAGNIQFMAGTVPYVVTSPGGQKGLFSVFGERLVPIPSGVGEYVQADGAPVANDVLTTSLVGSRTSINLVRFNPLGGITNYSFLSRNMYFGIRNQFSSHPLFAISTGNGTMSYQICYSLVPFA